jgi:hypothetical protein
MHVSWYEQDSFHTYYVAKVVTMDEAETIMKDTLGRSRMNSRPVNVHILQVTGQEPYLTGWRFLAAIDHEGDTNIVEQVPGGEVSVAEWSTVAAKCDHCQLNRLRLKTYVLSNSETHEVKQVGSTCIEDFFPGVEAKNIARLADLWVIIDASASEGDGEWGSGERSIDGWLREEVIAQAVAVVREDGFLGKGKAEQVGRPERATAVKVGNALSWRPSAKEPTEPWPVTDEDRENAAKVIEWVDELLVSDDYLTNLQNAVARPVTKSRHLGLVVSAVAAYDREVEHLARKEREEARAIPVVEGQRVWIEGTVLSRQLRETDWGSAWKLLLLVSTGDGEYKLWGTEASKIDTRVGDQIKFKASKVERSRDDESFGFWTRPSSATVVKRAEVEEESEDG